MSQAEISNSGETVNQWCSQGKGNQCPSLLQRVPQFNIPSGFDYSIPGSVAGSNYTFYIPTALPGTDLGIQLKHTYKCAGYKYRFIATTNAFYPNDQWTIQSQGNDINGSVITGTIDGSLALIPFVNSSELAPIFSTNRLQGDYIDLECDGVSWYVSGVIGVGGGP